MNLGWWKGFRDEILGIDVGQHRSIGEAFKELRNADVRAVIHSARGQIDRGDLPRDSGAMTFPMALAYLEAYAHARSCLGALADLSDFDDRCRFERLLIDLDGIHGGDFPATYPMLGTRPELRAP